MNEYEEVFKVGERVILTFFRMDPESFEPKSLYIEGVIYNTNLEGNGVGVLYLDPQTGTYMRKVLGTNELIKI